MGQIVQVDFRKQVAEKNAQWTRWNHELMPAGEFDEGAKFLGIWALIWLAGIAAFLIGWSFAS